MAFQPAIISASYCHIGNSKRQFGLVVVIKERINYSGRHQIFSPVAGKVYFFHLKKRLVIQFFLVFSIF